MRTIDYITGPTEIDEYQDQHRLENQPLHEGIPLDPTLRDHFDGTPNELREDAETNDWWERPFITSHTWEQQKFYNQEHLKNIKANHPEVLEEVLKIQEGAKEKWFAAHPSGVCYAVHCLDGGAWNRSTWWGNAETLEEAVQIAKRGPGWRNP